jgi:hypothetical protein
MTALTLNASETLSLAERAQRLELLEVAEAQRLQAVPESMGV